MPDAPDVIARFWDDFRKDAARLAKATSADNSTYDRLLQSLKQIHDGLFLEFSLTGEPRELIVTAEGQRELFPLVRRIVARAPRVEGWAIQALKPKLGFPVSTRWEQLTLPIGTVLFEPLERRGSDELGLRLFVLNLREHQLDDAHNAILRAIDHGLGEERFAESIVHTEVHCLPTDQVRDDLIPLVELEKFLDWRESRRH